MKENNTKKQEMDSQKACGLEVTLRALEPEDLEILYQIENDETVWNVGNTNVPYSRALLLDFITSATGDIYADKQVRLMAENGQGEVVGIVDVVNFDPRHHRAEIGIVVKKGFRRQGYATAILRKVMDYSKNVLYLHQLYAIVGESNKSSIKMLKAIGFQGDRLLKDWIFTGEKYESAYFFQSFL